MIAPGYTAPMTRTARIAAAALALAALAALAGCNAKAAGGQVEKKIVDWAKAQGVEIKQATCPKAIKVEVNTTFECKATTAADEALTFVGTITSKSGSNFEYSIKILEPTYFAEKAATLLHDELSQQAAGAPKSVTCGPPGLHKIPADHKVTCDVVAPDDKAVKVVLTFKDDGSLDGYDVQ